MGRFAGCFAEDIDPRGRNPQHVLVEMLAILSVAKCIVTADTLHCRADVAQSILDSRAD